MRFGREGDSFLGISKSGNSKNIMNATVVALVSGIIAIGLTGAKGGELATVSDVTIKIPNTGTELFRNCAFLYTIVCYIMLEDGFFGEGNESNINGRGKRYTYL